MPTSSGEYEVVPVTLPPGRARLPMSPASPAWTMLPSENLVNVKSRALKKIKEPLAVGHQPTLFDILTLSKDRGHPLLKSKFAIARLCEWKKASADTTSASALRSRNVAKAS